MYLLFQLMETRRLYKTDTGHPTRI